MNEPIKKLAPGAPHLAAVTLHTSRMDSARRRLDEATKKRRAAMAEAKADGASRDEIANAAGVSVVRVSQILGGVR